MPQLGLILDVEEQGFTAMRGMSPEHAAAAVESGQLIHLAEGAHLEIGALTRGMGSGRASVAICFKLPDGRVVLAETSLRLLLIAADTFATLYGERASDGA